MSEVVHRIGKLSILAAIAFGGAAVAAQGGAPISDPQSNADERLRRREEAWAKADTEILAYMRRSVTNVARGHDLAYKGFAAWYLNRPTENAPAIEVIFRYVLDTVILRGASAFIPHGGVFARDILVTFLQDGYKELSKSVRTVDSKDGLLARLGLESERLKTQIVSLPDEFEKRNPDLFEEAMQVYTDEELETPNIHKNSDLQLGSRTRQTLISLGFPEPNEGTINQTAEKVLYEMVHSTLVRLYGDTGGVLTPDQMEADAKVQTLKTLYPQNPERHCAEAWRLGMLRPRECFGRDR